MGKIERTPDEEQEDDPSSADDARQAAEEYASDQRGILKKLLEIIKPRKLLD